MDFKFSKNATEEQYREARKARDENTSFKLFLYSKKALTLEPRRLNIPRFIECCGKPTYICGSGRHETLDALEKYSGSDIEYVEVSQIHKR